MSQTTNKQIKIEDNVFICCYCLEKIEDYQSLVRFENSSDFAHLDCLIEKVYGK